MNIIDGPTKLVCQDAILGGLSIGQLLTSDMKISEHSLQAFLRGSLQSAVVQVEAFHEPVQNLHGFRPQQDLLTALLYRRQEPELVVNNHVKHEKNTPYKACWILCKFQNSLFIQKIQLKLYAVFKIYQLLNLGSQIT